MPVNGGEQKGTCPMYTHSSEQWLVQNAVSIRQKGVGEIHLVIHQLLQGKSLVYVYAGSVLADTLSTLPQVN